MPCFAVATPTISSEELNTLFNKSFIPDNWSPESIIGTLIHLHAHLTSLYPKLQPSPLTNTLFTRLVQLCIYPYDSHTTATILHDKRTQSLIEDLRKYASEGEGILEEYWACRMVNGTESGLPWEVLGEDILKQFPYYDNYVALARLELNAIESVSGNYNGTSSARPTRFAFIGSGPMPLTSICLAQLLDPVIPSDSEIASGSSTPTSTMSQSMCQTDVRLHNIDHNPRAIELSSQLCRKLGRMTRCMTFECTSADASKNSKTTNGKTATTASMDSNDLSTFDVVYLAALVGTSISEKHTIIKNVVGRMKEGSLLVLRSAHGLREVLYPVVNPTSLVQHGLKPLVEVRPYNEVVNSVIIAKVMEGKGSTRAVGKK